MQIQSKACCTKPPVVLAGGYDYEVKGKYEEYYGLKTYETGSPTAKRGIFLCYDVFGLYIQSLRGADILASDYAPFPDNAGDFKVFMPDFWGDRKSLPFSSTLFGEDWSFRSSTKEAATAVFSVPSPIQLPLALIVPAHLNLPLPGRFVEQDTQSQLKGYLSG